MATQEMKAKISLSGEQEFSRAMSAATREVKTLESEMKLAKAEFQATGNQQKYAAQQAQILKAQIAAQKKAVEQAENAIKQLTAQGVDPQSRAMQTWRTKLNNAKTTLTQMETRLTQVESELQDNTREFGNAETAAGEYQTQLEQIGGTIDTQAAIDSIDRITTAIQNTVRMAAQATKAIVNMARDAGAWADEVKTNAEQMGIDPETYQSWQYASNFIDTSVETIGKSWQDIGRKMKDGDEDFLASLAVMGIASRDAAGNLRDSKDIFWDAIDYLGSIDNEATRAAEATKLFGNDWRQLNPLINAGSAAYRQLAEEGREVAVVANEDVDALGSMDDSFQDMSSRFLRLKMDTLAALAPTFERVARALSKAITALDNFINSEEGQAALQSLGDALAGVIEEFIGADENGENGFGKLIEAAKDAVNGLKEALLWIKNNSSLVAGALKVIGLGFASLKVAEGVLTFFQLIKTTPLSKISTIFGSGASNAASSAASGTGTATKTSLLSGIRASMTGGELGAIALPAALVGMIWAGTNAVHENDAANIHQRAEEIRASTQEAAAAIGEGASDMAAALNLAADALDITDRKAFDGSTIISDPAKVNQTLRTFQEYEWLRDILDPHAWDQLQAIGTDASTLSGMEETELLETVAGAMMEQMEAEAAGETKKPTPETAFRKLKERGAFGEGDADDFLDISDWAFQDWGEFLENGGEDAVRGFVSGMKIAEPEAIAEAAAMAQAVKDTVENILDIHSPSRVMARLGLFTGEGFAQGIQDSTAQVERAVAGMLSIPGRGRTGAGAGGGLAGGNSYSSSFYIDKYYQRTEDDARALAQRVQDATGWRRNGFGHRA